MFDRLAGEGEALVHLPRFAGDLEPRVGTVLHLKTGTSELLRSPAEVGSDLFRAVFIGPVSNLFQQSLSRVEATSSGLRLRIRLNPRDRTLAPLLDWPWELLYRKDTEEFLALSRGTPIVRALDVPQPTAARIYRPPLRVLAVLARDLGSSPLKLEEELKQLRESLEEDPEIWLETLEDPDTQRLRNTLDQKGIHILHYMGHGVFEPASGDGALLFGGHEGRVPVTGRHLVAKVRDLDTLRLVVLNACETAVVRGETVQGPFAGVAAALVLDGLPAVVAMQSSIRDVHSVAFASAFYRRLARGMSVEEAVTEGRQAILSHEPETASWAIPVLFLRSAGSLFAQEQRALPELEAVPLPPDRQVVPAVASRARTWRSWVIVLGLLCVLLTFVVWLWPRSHESPPPAPRPAIYAVRVQVLDPQGQPVASSTIRISAGNEPQRTPDGWWEVEIPAAKVPAGGQITLWAEHPDWGGNRKDLRLGVDPNVRVEIRLKEPESWLRGQVIAESGRGLEGVRIFRQDGAPEEAITDVKGRFGLKLSVPPHTLVRLRAEYAGAKPGDDFCYAGRDSCRIILERIKK